MDQLVNFIIRPPRWELPPPRGPAAVIRVLWVWIWARAG
jgi:hypothetical protein